MSCENCNTREFVHADIYCNGCPGKPQPRIKKGRAYLFMKNRTKVICSVDIEAPEGSEFEVSAVELIRKLRIEFEDAG